MDPREKLNLLISPTENQEQGGGNSSVYYFILDEYNLNPNQGSYPHDLYKNFCKIFSESDFAVQCEKLYIIEKEHIGKINNVINSIITNYQAIEINKVLEDVKIKDVFLLFNPESHATVFLIKQIHSKLFYVSFLNSGFGSERQEVKITNEYLIKSILTYKIDRVTLEKFLHMIKICLTFNELYNNVLVFLQTKTLDIDSTNKYTELKTDITEDFNFIEPQFIGNCGYRVITLYELIYFMRDIKLNKAKYQEYQIFKRIYVSTIFLEQYDLIIKSSNKELIEYYKNTYYYTKNILIDIEIYIYTLNSLFIEKIQHIKEIITVIDFYFENLVNESTLNLETDIVQVIEFPSFNEVSVEKDKYKFDIDIYEYEHKLKLSYNTEEKTDLLIKNSMGFSTLDNLNNSDFELNINNVFNFKTSGLL